MDYMSNRAIVIAVSLFVTIMISSVVLFTISQTKVVYKQVYETDTAIQSNFDEFDAFDGAEKTQLDLYNALRKYKDNGSVYITSMTKESLQDVSTNSEKIALASSNTFNVNQIKSNLDIKPNESNNNKTVDTQQASIKYSTYIIRMDNDGVIIGFVNR